MKSYLISWTLHSITTTCSILLVITVNRPHQREIIPLICQCLVRIKFSNHFIFFEWPPIMAPFSSSWVISQLYSNSSWQLLHIFFWVKSAESNSILDYRRLVYVKYYPGDPQVKTDWQTFAHKEQTKKKTFDYQRTCGKQRGHTFGIENFSFNFSKLQPLEIV